MRFGPRPALRPGVLAWIADPVTRDFYERRRRRVLWTRRGVFALPQDAVAFVAEIMRENSSPERWYPVVPIRVLIVAETLRADASGRGVVMVELELWPEAWEFTAQILGETNARFVMTERPILEDYVAGDRSMLREGKR